MSWASAKLLRSGLFAALLVCAACGPQAPPPPKAIGEGYVVPETLDLRKDIAATSGTAATVKRGERVEIVARRRRFVKVRTARNEEGWTEQNRLLTPEVHRQIEQMSEQSAALPRLGVFRARDELNVHIEPYRWSPTLYQLREEEKVDLLGRRVAERTSGPPPDTPAPQAESREGPALEPVKAAPRDDWSLVRTAEGLAGWVLTRMIDADIPDEVAQYAEGRHIASYFALSEVIDGDRVKKVWLWTTIERSLEPHDFDSIRVFNWGRRRHRYETAHIERGLKGFFPVTVLPEVKTRYGKGPGFSFVVEKKDGQRYTRRYVMIGHLVRVYAEEPAAAPQPPAAPPPAASDSGPPAKEPSLLRRLWEKIRRR